MTTINKSAIVAHTPEEMFKLIDDIEAYPDFLPWCGCSLPVQNRRRMWPFFRPQTEIGSNLSDISRSGSMRLWQDNYGLRLLIRFAQLRVTRPSSTTSPRPFAMAQIRHRQSRVPHSLFPRPTPHERTGQIFPAPFVQG